MKSARYSHSKKERTVTICSVLEERKGENLSSRKGEVELLPSGTWKKSSPVGGREKGGRGKVLLEENKKNRVEERRREKKRGVAINKEEDFSKVERRGEKNFPSFI